jgi:predicted kinase
MNRMPDLAAWHLITGSTGAGKSTFARALQAQTNGVRFSIDEWMNTLFWPDCPAKNDLAFALDRIARCESQIAAVATQLARSGVDSVLDLGFTQRDHRLSWLARAQAANVPCTLHVLDIPADIRWSRVCERNTAGQTGNSPTFTFAVTREMFDFMESRWELPDAEERNQFEPKRGATG